jgi:hypothetical protein
MEGGIVLSCLVLSCLVLSCLVGAGHFSVAKFCSRVGLLSLQVYDCKKIHDDDGDEGGGVLR